MYEVMYKHKVIRCSHFYHSQRLQRNPKILHELQDQLHKLPSIYTMEYITAEPKNEEVSSRWCGKTPRTYSRKDPFTSLFTLMCIVCCFLWKSFKSVYSFFPLKCYYTFIFIYFLNVGSIWAFYFKKSKKTSCIIFGCTPAAWGLLVPPPGLEHVLLCLGRAQSQPLNHQGSPLIFKVVVIYTQHKIDHCNHFSCTVHRH